MRFLRRVKGFSRNQDIREVKINYKTEDSKENWGPNCDENEQQKNITDVTSTDHEANRYTPNENVKLNKEKQKRHHAHTLSEED